ncbi:hypothetical protein F5890DRAFT_709830 [Lentinula detonsa]|uniref:Secreted protein n=1 Tax=Lentinula detonsa TaxID=2804962 RepID=A0AA38QAD9_9AGAR|nr:hypothetical protein F5890DRAFT_709830 [Lentinula detonsa]
MPLFLTIFVTTAYCSFTVEPITLSSFLHPFQALSGAGVSFVLACKRSANDWGRIMLAPLFPPPQTGVGIEKALRVWTYGISIPTGALLNSREFWQFVTCFCETP